MVAGIQDQDQHAGRLAFRARSSSLLAADIDRARTEERSLLRAWVMRKTVHLVASEDAGWLLGLYEDRFARDARRRLGQLGVEPRTVDRSLALIERALGEEGPMTRDGLSELLSANGLLFDNGQRLHMFMLATSTGIACMGPGAGKRICLVRRDDWLGKLPAREREPSLAELARRYIGAFGPATDADLASWSGLGLGAARLGLERIGAELEEVRIDGSPAWVLRSRGRLPPAGTLRMLPRFDTYMVGYRRREHALSPELDAEVNAGGGMIHATIVRDGEVIGTWRWRLKGDRIEIELRPFDPHAGGEAELRAEVEGIGRFTGREAVVVS